MIFIILSLSIMGCGQHENETASHRETASEVGNVYEDTKVTYFSHIDSPCIDGIIANMNVRGCKISIIEMDDSSTRYFCDTADKMDRTNMWMSRSFYAFSNDLMIDDLAVSEKHLYEACTDWSHTVFYR